MTIWVESQNNTLIETDLSANFCPDVSFCKEDEFPAAEYTSQPLIEGHENPARSWGTKALPTVNEQSLRLLDLIQNTRKH